MLGRAPAEHGMTALQTPGRTAADRVQEAAARRPLGLLMAGIVLYSVGPVLVQASGVSGVVFGFWRLWLGVPVLGAATLLGIRAGGRRPGLRAWRWPLWAGACFGLHQLLFFSALKATSVTDVSLMNVLSPLLVALLAVPLFGERPGAGFRAWSLLAMAGAVVVVLGASAGPQGDPLGMLMAAGNVVGFAGFFLLSKRARSEIDVLPFLFGVIVVAAVTVSAVALIWGEPIGDVAARDLGLALAVAAAPGALGHFLATWPLHRVAANLPPLLKLGQPVLSGALAYAALGEPVTAAHLAGGALTLVGVLGAARSSGGRRLVREAETLRTAA
jgi:drug/metabolite transporter (DMT)-like permease